MLKSITFLIRNRHRKIYRDIIDLKLEVAREKVTQMEKSEPQNLARLHLENYVDFFEIFIKEDEARFKVLEKK